MAGFIRRFSYFPGADVIRQIEGATIVDLPPPGNISGSGTGVVCVIGEFADAGYAVDANATTGVVAANLTPVEVFTAQDLVDKVGAFDETLGQFSGALGNGFATIRNKSFARLVVMPIDNITPAAGSTGALRFWRDLPTNQSATVPQPIVPVPGAVVSAARQFVNGANRVRVAQRFLFTDTVAFKTAVDGSVTTAAAAATQTFTSAGGDFINVGVQVGDILVSGVIGTSLGANAGTYRVTAFTATTLTVQRMDGTNFNFTTEAALPYRVHAAAVADTAGSVMGAHVNLASAAGYGVPGRPLDATIAAALALTPSVAPPAGTATTYDPLSGLAGVTHPTTACTYDANLHAPNAGNNATLDARYQNAIDAILTDDDPARDVNVVLLARKSATIRAKAKSHVQTASSRGLTRVAAVSPPISTVSLNTVLGDADPGVGTQRDERMFYSWPGAITSIPEAVGFTVATADGKTTADGLLDTSGDGWLAAVLSNLAPERNPGQASDPVPRVMAPVLGFQRGVSRLGLSEYTQLRQKGVCALRLDKTAGPIFQSGVTSSLTTGQTNINRRRFADFVQDSIAARLNQLAKQPLTSQLKDSAVAEVTAFLNDLLSPNNPPAQRIDAYQVDDKSGNTPSLTSQGIFVIIVRVRMTPTADFIVLQTEIGESVTITQAA